MTILVRIKRHLSGWVNPNFQLNKEEKWRDKKYKLNTHGNTLESKLSKVTSIKTSMERPANKDKRAVFKAVSSRSHLAKVEGQSYFENA